MFKDVLMPIFIVLGVTAILVALLNFEDAGYCIQVAENIHEVVAKLKG